MLVWLRRLTLVVGWGLVLIMLAALIALWWLTATPGGVQWGVTQAERHLEALTVDEVTGTPWRGMHVAGLVWAPEQGPGLQLELGRLQIDPGALWRARLRISELSLDGVEVQLPPAGDEDEAEPRGALPAIPAVAVDVERLRAERVVIHQGGTRYELAEVSLSAQLEARDQPPLVTTSLQTLDLRLPDALRVNGSGELRVGLDGPMPVAAQLEILVDHPQGWLDGSVTVDGTLQEGLGLMPRLAWVGADGARAAICGQLTADAERLAVESLRVDGLGGQLDLRGEARWAPSWSVDLIGEGRSFDPAWIEPSLPGALDFAFEAQIEAANGWLPGRGRVVLSDLQGRLAGESLDNVTLELQADEARASARLSGTAAGGQLRFDGQLTPERTFDAEWQIDALPVAADEGARRTVRLASRGRVDGRLPDWQAEPTLDDWIEASRVRLEDGRLRLTEHVDGNAARSAEMRLAGQLDNGRLAVERLALDSPGTELSANGSVQLSPDWARWRIEAAEAAVSIPELADLPWDLIARLPGVDPAALRPDEARGKVTMFLQAAGPLLAPHGRLDLQTDGLRLAGYSLARAKADIRLDRPSTEAASLDDRDVRLSIEADDLRPTAGGSALFDRLVVEADGRRADHRWTVDLEGVSEGALEAHLDASGGWRDGAWQGRVSRLTLDSPWAGGWRLPGQAELLLSAAVQRIDDLCLAPMDATPDGEAPGSVCLEGERREGRLQASVQGDLALHDLWRQWRGGPADVTWAGRLRLDGEADLGPAGRSAELSLRLPASELRLEATGGDGVEPEVVTYPDTRLAATLAGERVEAELEGGVEDWLVIAGQGRLALADRSLDGRLSLERTDIGRVFALADRLFGPLAAPVSELSGSVEGQLVVHGRLDAPRMSGRLSGQGLGFTSLSTGTSYRDGRLELRIDPAGRLDLTGSLLGEADTPPKPVFEDARVTETPMPPSRGRIQLDGSGQVTTLDDWQVSATLGGEATPLLRLPSLAVDARPELEGKFTPAGGRLSGSIHVPLAIANVERLPENARRNSQDLVIVGEEAEPRQGGYPLSGDIKVVLGDAVSLRGQGLATRLTGGLEMRLRPGQPVGAFGEIRLVDGRYEAYGQLLSVERGRLIFAGSLTSPGLDVVATREIQDEAGTVVGLQIVGPIDSPETEVFSRPPTSPSDALSLLLTGRRLSAGSDADASLLLNAIAGLGIRQGDEMAQQVKSVFGIDEIGFTTSGGAEGARLSVGKRIGENLLVRYAVGVFDGVGEVITRYRINRFLHLELTSSAQSQSGDLIYQIDRGRPED